MQTKKFISTLKGYKTKFTNNPNKEKELSSITSLVEKQGGKLEVIALLNEQGQEDLKVYVKDVLGLTKAVASEKPAVRVIDKQPLRVYHSADGNEYTVKEGVTYKVDTIKKTLKRISKDLSTLNVEDIPTMKFLMTVYQRYLKDKFPGEDCPLKKDKIIFRGYRISCSLENGFMVEDSQKAYEVVATPWEGIPTPKELGEWFKKPVKEFSSEEERDSYERGKAFIERREKEKELLEKEREQNEVDFEHLRHKVLSTIDMIRSKTVDFDPTTFPEMIPFKRWKRMANNLVTKWKTRKIRYAKFINEMERITIEETFTIRKVAPKFVGTLRPQYKEVGYLQGNKIEVDGRWIDAVPFLLECLLFEHKKCMYQIMKYAMGQITMEELLDEPDKTDRYVEYNKKALANTAENAQILTMMFDIVGLVPPQDLCYNADLKVGDKIKVFYDGGFHRKTVANVDREIILGREEGLLKLDRWLKIETED